MNTEQDLSKIEEPNNLVQVFALSEHHLLTFRKYKQHADAIENVEIFFYDKGKDKSYLIYGGDAIKRLRMVLNQLKID